MQKAFVILGSMKQCGVVVPTAGFLFGTEQPSLKQLKAMGFDSILQVDQASTNGNAPEKPTLFFFDRSPSADQVVKADVIFEGKKTKLGDKEIKKGEPIFIIPEVKGSIAERLLTLRNAPNGHDLIKQKRLQREQERGRRIISPRIGRA